MKHYILASPIPLALFGASALFGVLSGLWPRFRAVWALLAALCAIGGLLTGLVLGASLEETLTSVLLLTAVSLWPLTREEKGDRDEL